MTKINVWEIVNKEATTVIKAIEKGEIKTVKEYHDYVEPVYSWRVSEAIENLVSAYMTLNNIEMAWDYELEESVE